MCAQPQPNSSDNNKCNSQGRPSYYRSHSENCRAGGRCGEQTKTNAFRQGKKASQNLLWQHAGYLIMSVKLWVKLYFGSDNNDEASELLIPIGSNVNALKAALLERKKGLQGYDAEDLYVYAPGTVLPAKEEGSLDTRGTVPQGTDIKKPLRVNVVATENLKEQQDQQQIATSSSSVESIQRGMYPKSIPSEIDCQVLSLGGESLSSSGCFCPQELLWKALRMRDKQTCVLSGKKLPKTSNVQAAHILGVEESFQPARTEAGVWNPYDTLNGMLLESSLRTDFEANLWCMDEFLIVHVSEAGKLKGLQHWEGRKLSMQVNEQNYPSTQILRVRYELFKKHNMACESKISANQKKPGDAV